MKSSGRNQPCPVCQRTKDSDCRWNDETILCHTGTDLKSGDTITIGGQEWAFIHHNGGHSNRAAVFKPHRPRSRDQWRRDIQRRTPSSPSELLAIQTKSDEWTSILDQFFLAFDAAWNVADFYDSTPDQLTASFALIDDAQTKAAALAPHLPTIWREHADLKQLHKLRVEEHLKSIALMANDARRFQEHELGVPCRAAVYAMAEEIS